MSTQTTTVCDVGNQEHSGFIRNMNMMVIFTAETTEGRSVEPYLTIEKMDICDKCYERIVRSKTLLTGSGAQGHNTYGFAEATWCTLTWTYQMNGGTPVYSLIEPGLGAILV